MIKTGQRLLLINRYPHNILLKMLHLLEYFNTFTLNWALVYILLNHLVTLGQFAMNLQSLITISEQKMTMSAADKEFCNKNIVKLWQLSAPPIQYCLTPMRNLFRVALSRCSRVVMSCWGCLFRKAWISGCSVVLSQSIHLSCCKLTFFWPLRQARYHTAALHEKSWQSSLTMSTVFSADGVTSNSMGRFRNSDASKIFKPEKSLGRVISFIFKMKYEILAHVKIWRKFRLDYVVCSWRLV